MPRMVPPIVIESGRNMCSASMNAAATSAMQSAKSAPYTASARTAGVLSGIFRMIASRIASDRSPPSSSTSG